MQVNQGQRTVRDTTHKYVTTVAARDLIPLGKRQWGMTVTVITDPTPANNVTWTLVYNLANTNLSSNLNWQITKDQLQVPPKFFGVAFSDETTPITAGTGKVTFHMPFNMTLTEVIVELGTAQASGTIFTVDLNQSGVSVLSTKATIDNTEETSITAATPPVISVSALTKGSKMTVDVDQVGNGSALGGKIWLIGV